MFVRFAKFTEAEESNVAAIVKRAHALFQEHGNSAERLSIRMDIAAIHLHTPLDLEGLLAADDGNFAHDIGGIRRFLDRETGQLTECFLPRFTLKRTGR